MGMYAKLRGDDGRLRRISRDRFLRANQELSGCWKIIAAACGFTAMGAGWFTPVPGDIFINLRRRTVFRGHAFFARLKTAKEICGPALMPVGLFVCAKRNFTLWMLARNAPPRQFAKIAVEQRGLVY